MIASKFSFIDLRGAQLMTLQLVNGTTTYHGVCHYWYSGSHYVGKLVPGTHGDLRRCVPAGLNVLLVFFCPETPRWLFANGKEEQARLVLAKLHSSTADPKSPLIDLEMEEIAERVMLDGADKRFWDLRPLFRSRRELYRTGLVCQATSNRVRVLNAASGCDGGVLWATQR